MFSSIPDDFTVHSPFPGKLPIPRAAADSSNAR